jgi:hypothetical protein
MGFFALNSGGFRGAKNGPEWLKVTGWGVESGTFTLVRNGTSMGCDT